MNDVDILDIQALLGHADISSTQIYTHTDAGRLRSAVQRLPDIRSKE
jgi:integrase/recombinase XerC